MRLEHAVFLQHVADGGDIDSHGFHDTRKQTTISG